MREAVGGKEVGGGGRGQGGEGGRWGGGSGEASAAGEGVPRVFVFCLFGGRPKTPNARISGKTLVGRASGVLELLV